MSGADELAAELRAELETAEREGRGLFPLMNDDGRRRSSWMVWTVVRGDREPGWVLHYERRVPSGELVRETRYLGGESDDRGGRELALREAFAWLRLVAEDERADAEARGELLGDQ